MLNHLYPALVTCLALLVYTFTFMSTAAARGRYKIQAPAVTGHPEFEKRIRVQQNTVEQLILFLPSLWIFSLTVSQLWGGILGLVFVVARFYYALSYASDPNKRGPGFGIGALATLVLLIGASVGVIWVMVTGEPI